MKDSIYTIPISEVFEPKDGCPICRLRDTLEERCIEYIMGAAMMEPDIRIETNKAGFCGTHLDMMLKYRNRLSIALMFESHLDYILKEIIGQKPTLLKGDKRYEQLGTLAKDCYVCSKIEWSLSRMVDTVLKLWLKEPSFQSLYAEQPVLCLQHYALLTEKASKQYNKKQFPEFMQVSTMLTERYLRQLKDDITGFCKLYDYRNANSKGGEVSDAVKTSIERSVWYLTSRTPKIEEK